MKRLAVGTIEMAYIERGEGMPVVLVHGFPLDHTMWETQIEPLARAFRVIAPDLRGFGHSGASDGAVTMEQMADDLAGLLDAMGIDEPVALCGLSMGGYVAFQFWRRHRRRLRGLILADTRAQNDTPEVAAGRLEMAQRVLQDGPAPLVETMMPKLFAEATVANRPEVVESLRQVMMGTDPTGIAAAARGMAERPDVTDLLPTIDCPTLVIVGNQDAISPPEEMSQIAAAIPDARFVEIAASGHMSPMEKPVAVNLALLKFLDSL